MEITNRLYSGLHSLSVAAPMMELKTTTISADISVRNFMPIEIKWRKCDKLSFNPSRRSGNAAAVTQFRNNRPHRRHSNRATDMESAGGNTSAPVGVVRGDILHRASQRQQTNVGKFLQECI